MPLFFMTLFSSVLALIVFQAWDSANPIAALGLGVKVSEGFAPL